MKSIMEEASTIFKAIEKAWLRAEKPQSFSVKVLEEAEKNFFGMTTKSAKIALLFEEAWPQQHAPKQKTAQTAAQPQKKVTQQPSAHAPKEPAKRQPQTQRAEPTRQAQPQQQKERAEKREQRPAPAPRATAKESVDNHTTNNQPNTPPVVWTPELTQAATSWIDSTVKALNHEVSFESSVENNQLYISFNKPLIDNGRDRLLFSSLAHLLMQSIRHSFKNQTRGLKVNLRINQ